MSNKSDIIIRKVPKNIIYYVKENLMDIRPIQKKAIEKGLFDKNKNFLISSPTGSGKTFVGELAILDIIINHQKKAIYILPLKAMANETYKYFSSKYRDIFKVRVSVGELQNEFFNMMFDLLIVTSEKLDSLIRQNKEFLNDVGVIVIDEIHMLNDEKRGPTLEILLTMFKTFYSHIKLIGLSATISNGKELAKWLNAVYINDNWRPIELRHFVLSNNELKRYK